jgi:9-cis-epoxycarotenoid dioxygenase
MKRKEDLAFASQSFGRGAQISGASKISGFFLRACLCVLDYGGGIGTTNVGLTFFNDKLLVMFEENKPYVVHITNDGDFRTIGK